MINHWGQSGPDDISSYHYTYDTTINGQVHKRFEDWGTTPGTTHLRESNDSIFMYSPNCNSDLLLYNFGLQVGDTFLLYYGGLPCTYPEWFVADTVSTVMLLTGQTVPYIHLVNGFRELRWIYHVGDVNYGFFNSYWVEGFDQFICASDSSGLLWLSSNPYVTPLCDSFTSISKSEVEEITVIAFPNPASNSVILKWQQDSQFNWLIIETCTGKLLYSIPIKGEEIMLDVSHLSSGLYFYSLLNEEGKSANGKLMIEK